MNTTSERPLTFGSLFAGIGGFDLGFERAGMVCKWQVEIDDYANRVLAKHWPDVRRWPDVRTWPQPDTERVDVICGGFPCQDISYAGQGAGLDGERSGLFFEAVRVVRELQPRIVVLENVAALLTRGLDRVLGTLAEIGYDAEWHCIPAAAVGAPHIRNRVFVLGWNTDSKHDGQVGSGSAQNTNTGRDRYRQDQSKSIPDANGERLEGMREEWQDSGWEDSDGHPGSGSLGSGTGPQLWSTLARFRGIPDEFPEGLDEGGLLKPESQSIMGVNDSQERTSHADAEKTRPNQAMPIMQQAIASPAIQGATRGSSGVSSPEVLRPEVHGSGDDARRTSDGGTEEAGGQTQGGLLRTLRDGGRFTHPPHGYGPSEQRTIEPENALRIVSHVMALDARQPQEFSGETATTVQRLRQGMCEAKTGNVPETLSAIQEVWRSASDKEKDWFVLRVGTGSPWCGEWPEQPRVETGVHDRVHRLRGLGNAVVPQVAEYIGNRITKSMVKS